MPIRGHETGIEVCQNPRVQKRWRLSERSTRFRGETRDDPTITSVLRAAPGTAGLVASHPARRLPAVVQTAGGDPLAGQAEHGNHLESFSLVAR